jgi:hypothetical protein
MKTLADASLDCLAALNYRYETYAGVEIRAARPDDLKAALRDRRWKNVSNLDASDFRAMGFTITHAQYVGGARKTGRFVEVVTL